MSETVISPPKYRCGDAVTVTLNELCGDTIVIQAIVVECLEDYEPKYCSPYLKREYYWYRLADGVEQGTRFPITNILSQRVIRESLLSLTPR